MVAKAKHARSLSPEDALRQAAVLVGGNGELARLVGVTPQAVSQWKKAPPNRAIAIEKAVHGEITRYQLRPDVFGEPQMACGAEA